MTKYDNITLQTEFALKRKENFVKTQTGIAVIRILMYNPANGVCIEEKKEFYQNFKRV